MPDGPNIQANYLDGLQEGYRFAQSEVPTIVMEMALYGINSSLSTVTAIMLLRRNTAEGLAHKWLLMVLMLMFMIATAYVVLSIVGFYQDRPGNADNLSTFLFSSARPSLLIIQAALGDSVTIWRCYEVFGKNVIVIMLPALTALASFIFGLYSAGTGTRDLVAIFVPYDPIYAWARSSGVWAAITMVCTIYCAFAISYKIYSSARLTKSNKLFATIFFVVETSLIYTLGVVLYVTASFVNLSSALDAREVLMATVVQLPPLVLCLLILQTRFYNGGSQAIRYTNPERARPWDALRRIFGTRRKAPADSQTSTLRVDPIAVHVSTHAISVPAEAPSTDAADDMSNEDYRELDALGQQEKKVSHVLDIA